MALLLLMDIRLCWLLRAAIRGAAVGNVFRDFACVFAIARGAGRARILHSLVRTRVPRWISATPATHNGEEDQSCNHPCRRDLPRLGRLRTSGHSQLSTFEKTGCALQVLGDRTRPTAGT